MIDLVGILLVVLPAAFFQQMLIWMLWGQVEELRDALNSHLRADAQCARVLVRRRLR